jgi:hypothetical protein
MGNMTKVPQGRPRRRETGARFSHTKSDACPVGDDNVDTMCDEKLKTLPPLAQSGATRTSLEKHPVDGCLARGNRNSQKKAGVTVCDGLPSFASVCTLTLSPRQCQRNRDNPVDQLQYLLYVEMRAAHTTKPAGLLVRQACLACNEVCSRPLSSAALLWPNVPVELRRFSFARPVTTASAGTFRTHSPTCPKPKAPRPPVSVD